MEVKGEIIIATTGKRLVSFLVDYFIIILLMMGVHPLFLPTDWDMIPYQNVMGELYPMYLIGLAALLCKDVVQGISPGKALLNLRVSQTDEKFSYTSPKSLITRNLFLVIFPIELLLMVLDKKSRRLGDKYTNTIVIEEIGEPEFRIQGVRILSVIVLFIGLWLLFTFSTPVGIKKSSGYQLSKEVIFSNPDVFDMVGNIQSIGYWPEVVYKRDRTHYTIKVSGEYGDKAVKVTVNSRFESGVLTPPTKVLDLRILNP